MCNLHRLTSWRWSTLQAIHHNLGCSIPKRLPVGVPDSRRSPSRRARARGNGAAVLPCRSTPASDHTRCSRAFTTTSASRIAKSASTARPLIPAHSARAAANTVRIAASPVSIVMIFDWPGRRFIAPLCSILHRRHEIRERSVRLLRRGATESCP
jgi:hypothetical protein